VPGGEGGLHGPGEELLQPLLTPAVAVVIDTCCCRPCHLVRPCWRLPAGACCCFAHAAAPYWLCVLPVALLLICVSVYPCLLYLVQPCV
jgi:hypothetical protein